MFTTVKYRHSILITSQKFSLLLNVHKLCDLVVGTLLDNMSLLILIQNNSISLTQCMCITQYVHRISYELLYMQRNIAKFMYVHKKRRVLTFVYALWQYTIQKLDFPIYILHTIMLQLTYDWLFLTKKYSSKLIQIFATMRLALGIVPFTIHI